MAIKMYLLSMALVALIRNSIAQNPERHLETTEGIPSNVTYD